MTVNQKAAHSIFGEKAEIIAASALAYTFSFSGFILAALTGWLGGELIDRLSVGVDDGAYLDAPSSLSNRSANQNAPNAARF